ncbi:DUF3482 domain-containing protein [Salinisphaera sp. Q1T1-3]|uniref:DUF3482 domain-containing protein n=1 Tax=Salinisphaera sp. Q1T1-3 TaxID=2321229 RepID=UPI000E72F8A5|nr:DUF3482 domain-containing protein [Salinisphaera sp. Q1T1-3]RJS91948.1 DUF3482 domain-containing protein [Salinisphaera sp. Q1T1-3]
MTRLSERREPTRWVAEDAPTFAVVGKVNMGKSAVLATLLEEDDDAVIRISAEPGETTRCQRLSLVLDGRERLRFIDTPGFQQPIEALRTIRAMGADDARGPGPDTLARFVARYGDSDEFVDECRLLAPIVEGAGVVYVVDPGVRLHDAFLAEIEILRLSAGPRLAILNPHAESDDASRSTQTNEALWRDELGKAFNLVRTFNAFEARFAARRDLLAALNQIDERDRNHLDATLALLDTEWEERRDEAAERILRFLGTVLRLREHTNYVDDGAPEAARKKALTEANRRYFERIAELERETTNDLLALYRHRHTRAEAAELMTDELDLSHDETWRRFGLNRRQLTFAGAATGAAGGTWLDVATAGHTLGLATLIGGGVGGALAWFKGDALPTLNLSVGRPGAFGGRQLSLGPPKNPNFAWILFDVMLVRYRAIMARTHAARGDGRLAHQRSADEAESIVRQLESSRQKLLARWFREAQRNTEQGERDVQARKAIEATLAEIEQAMQS